MGIMDIKKTISNYTKIYRKALIKAKISDIDAEIAMFLKERLNIAFQNVCILRCLSNMVLGAYVRFSA